MIPKINGQLNRKFQKIENLLSAGKKEKPQHRLTNLTAPTSDHIITSKGVSDLFLQAGSSQTHFERQGTRSGRIPFSGVPSADRSGRRRALTREESRRISATVTLWRRLPSEYIHKDHENSSDFAHYFSDLRPSHTDTPGGVPGSRRDPLSF